MNKRKPEWLRIRPPTQRFHDLKSIISSQRTHTVCQESHCPNMSECWSSGTATFILMGDTCTRACNFCAVKSKFPGEKLDPDELKRVADTIKRMNLNYVVLTSVDRDDLDDLGANHFANCIRMIKKNNPSMLVEVLTPDFQGRLELVDIVVDANPDVFGHNIETVKNLQKRVRDPRANYDQSLSVLRRVKERNPNIYTKSSLMLGLGETEEEVLGALLDLREAGVSIVTIGQYLRPGDKNLPVEAYIPPEKFEFYDSKAKGMGFLYSVSGPFVRSSYKAGELFMTNVFKSRREIESTSID